MDLVKGLEVGPECRKIWKWVRSVVNKVILVVGSESDMKQWLAGGADQYGGTIFI